MGVCVCVYIYTVLKASARIRKGVGSSRLVAADGTALIAVEPWPPKRATGTVYASAIYRASVSWERP
jgi:hypothetical protein